ncbi:MAG: hypothetical protein GY842_20825 [bacterium]|nr:hypothetical protein [bacterium]
MKLVAVNLLALIGVVVAALALGYRPTEGRWGAEGLASMWAAAVICLAAGVASAVPVAVVGLSRPTYVGQAALAGTGIRLALTAFLALGYQSWTAVHLSSFLTWLLILYLLLLAAETIISVTIVRALWRAPAPDGR